MPPMPTIAENLSRLRKAKKLSQAKLAAVSGVSQQLISQIETGKNETTKELPALAHALKVGVHEIDENFVPVDDAFKVVKVETGSQDSVLLQFKFLGAPTATDEELIEMLVKASPAERQEFLMLLRMRHGHSTP